MCLIAFAIDASAQWPLVIASNRDEFLDRPTLQLSRWRTATGQEIISGRDLRAGGTWLGMTPGGRVAFLTNVRQAEALPAPLSRGELVTRWLEGHEDARQFGSELGKVGARYGGFNLVLGDLQRQRWSWLSNRPVNDKAPCHVHDLPAGVYGLSNAALDTPWPKTVALKQALAGALAGQGQSPENENALKERLWTALMNRDHAATALLPSTGVRLAIEQALSSAFVDFPEHSYGTRSSTLLLARKASEAPGVTFELEERAHLHTQNGHFSGESTFARVLFELDHSAHEC